MYLSSHKCSLPDPFHRTCERAHFGDSANCKQHGAKMKRKQKPRICHQRWQSDANVVSLDQDLKLGCWNQDEQVERRR